MDVVCFVVSSRELNYMSIVASYICTILHISSIRWTTRDYFAHENIILLTRMQAENKKSDDKESKRERNERTRKCQNWQEKRPFDLEDGKTTGIKNKILLTWNLKKNSPPNSSRKAGFRQNLVMAYSDYLITTPCMLNFDLYWIRSLYFYNFT